MTADARDRIITELADNEDRLARDLAGVRELLHLSLGQMHERECEVKRLHETHNRLRAEYRKDKAMHNTNTSIYEEPKHQREHQPKYKHKYQHQHKHQGQGQGQGQRQGQGQGDRNGHALTSESLAESC